VAKPSAFSRARVVAFETAFGSLERAVLEALWRASRSVSVRELQSAFPDLAYTTLMTTLDRLHKKGVLQRERAGRAFLYAPRFTRELLYARLAEEAIAALLGDAGPGARPVLSCFVEAVTRRDAVLLEELERLVREAREKEQP
jgi:predicted transcriptional regulator